MTLTDILTRCYERTNFPSSPDASVVSRFKNFVNDSVREVLADPIIIKLRNDTVPIATVANAATCALYEAITAIDRIVDRGNQFELIETDQAWIRRQDPGQLVTGTTPTNYAVVGYNRPISKQPSDSSQLYIKSTSAADTQAAYLEVITSQGYLRKYTIANLTGVTAVAAGPSDTIDVRDFYLASVAAGEITLLEDSGSGTELARIGIGRTRTRHCVLEFFPMTSAIVTLYADIQWAIEDMVNATDEPLIPDDYMEAVINLVRAREFDKREKWQMADRARRDAVPHLSRLKKYVHSRRGQSQLGRPPRWSQLGPYYPVGS